ncbi:MAG TPA: type II toxin-antitoxin system VapC family toxin [Gemmatimonadaceae bacterium]
MILADTSIWIQHLRVADPRLVDALEANRICIHPLVIGEIACGNLRNRAELLELLARLPGVSVATDTEALEFLEQHALMGRGIGFVDVHLLASTALSAAQLWTHDRRLAAVAIELSLARRACMRFIAERSGTRQRLAGRLIAPSAGRG